MNIFAKLKELEERLDDMELIENEFIEPVETGLGTELIIKDQPPQAEEVASNEYNGMFKVVKNSNGGIDVVNGINPETSFCGWFAGGSQNMEIAKAENVGVAAKYIALEIGYERPNPTIIATSYPVPVNGTFREPIAYIDDQGNIYQLFYGAVITPKGVWL